MSIIPRSHNKDNHYVNVSEKISEDPLFTDEDISFEVEDLCCEKKYFHLSLHIVWDLLLSSDAKVLYGTLKRWCWFGEKICLSTSQLVKKSNLSRSAVYAAKKELTENRPELDGKSLITISRRYCPRTGREISAAIFLTNIWEQNIRWVDEQIKEYYALKKAAEKDEGEVSVFQTPPVSNTNTYKRIINKRDKEKVEKESPTPPSQIPKPITKPPKPAASPPSPEAQELASFIFEKVKSRVPKAKPPNLTTWAKQLDREMKKNGWTVDELKKVVEFGWTQMNTWWHILSPSGLFNRYTEAINKMKTSERSADMTHEKQKKEDAIREQAHSNRAWLRKASDQLRDELKKNNMRIHDLWVDHTEVSCGEKRYRFYFNNSNFKQEFIEKLGETPMREYLLNTPVGKKVLIKK